MRRETLLNQLTKALTDYFFEGNVLPRQLIFAKSLFTS